MLVYAQTKTHANPRTGSMITQPRNNLKDKLTSLPLLKMFLCYDLLVFSSVQIDGKKVSSIKDLVQEAQPDEEELTKQQEVGEKLKAFLMASVH